MSGKGTALSISRPGLPVIGHIASGLIVGSSDLLKWVKLLSRSQTPHLTVGRNITSKTTPKRAADFLALLIKWNLGAPPSVKSILSKLI